MKKLLAVTFLLSTMAVMGADEGVAVFDKEVQGVNKEQLEIREIPTEEVILKSQKVESYNFEMDGNYE